MVELVRDSFTFEEMRDLRDELRSDIAAESVRLAERVLANSPDLLARACAERLSNLILREHALGCAIRAEVGS